MSDFSEKPLMVPHYEICCPISCYNCVHVCMPACMYDAYVKEILSISYFFKVFNIIVGQC